MNVLKLLGGVAMYVGGMLLVDDGLRRIRRRRMEAEEFKAERERERRNLLAEVQYLRREARELRLAAAAEVKPA